MILVDSSKYISWLRQGNNPVLVLESVLRANALVSCGVVRIEVLRGIVNPSISVYMKEFFAIVPEVPLSPAVIEQAVELSWALDRKGIVLPTTDIVIGVCARTVGATLIAEDRHFASIPGIVTANSLPAAGKSI